MAHNINEAEVQCVGCGKGMGWDPKVAGGPNICSSCVDDDDKFKKAMKGNNPVKEETGGPCSGCGKNLPLVWGKTYCKDCVDKGKGPDMSESVKFLRAVITEDYVDANESFVQRMTEKVNARIAGIKSAIKLNEDYNGWKNRQTWNVALWIGNDEGLYNMAREYAKSDNPYKDFVDALKDIGGGAIAHQTPDNVSWNDSDLDIDALDDMMRDLVSENFVPESAEWSAAPKGPVYAKKPTDCHGLCAGYCPRCNPQGKKSVNEVTKNDEHGEPGNKNWQKFIAKAKDKGFGPRDECNDDMKEAKDNYTDKFEKGDKGQSRVPCKGCGGPVPWNQGTDYCAKCIKADRP